MDNAIDKGNLLTDCCPLMRGEKLYRGMLNNGIRTPSPEKSGHGEDVRTNASLITREEIPDIEPILADCKRNHLITSDVL